MTLPWSLIVQVSKNDKLPLELNAIYQLYESCLSDINGKNPFIIGYEAEGYYQVPPGDYVIIVFTNDPDVPKDFALVVATRRGYKVPLRWDIFSLRVHVSGNVPDLHCQSHVRASCNEVNLVSSMEPWIKASRRWLCQNKARRFDPK